MKKVCVYKQQPNRNIPCPYIKVSPKFLEFLIHLEVATGKHGDIHGLDRHDSDVGHASD